jgi:succinoglycan biosynthesis protein ExoM
MLDRLLLDIAKQETEGQFTFSVVVTDNDPAESAKTVVDKCQRECLVPFSSQRTEESGMRERLTEEAQVNPDPVTNAQRAGSPLSILYTVEVQKNIALARNTALSHATGDYIVCIDDDEFPLPGWLLHLYTTCEKYGVAGVLGPVLPHFGQSTPRWVINGRFYDRPRHETGFQMPWNECRTGNVLFRRSILPPEEPSFRPEFGTGGEDQDFFRRMIAQGHQFIWCDEAIAYEEVPPQRCRRGFLLNRALLRGKNSLRQRHGRLKNLLKAVIAVPVYLLALPFLFLVGHHYFMRYSVKLADHTGRILALFGLNLVNERRM